MFASRFAGSIAGWFSGWQSIKRTGQSGLSLPSLGAGDPFRTPGKM